MWEETDECKELDDVSCRLKFSLVYVYAIAKRLECVETDSYRQDEMQEQSVIFSSKEQVCERRNKEVVILEYTKNQEIDDDVQSIDSSSLSAILSKHVNQQSCNETTRRGECYKEKESPIPPSVEDVGYHHDEEVLQLKVLVENEPIEQEHYRQKDGELDGIERHFGLLYLMITT